MADNLESTKVFAAVLLAGIGFVGAGLIGGALVKPRHLAQTAINIEVPKGEGGPVAATPDPPVETLLASADVGRGESQVKQQGCVACHSFNQGGKAGVGPNLYGVVGAPHGHEEGFAYSAALKSKTGPWTFDELNEWLKKPNGYAPGTKMTYAGLADPKKRADIIDYLRSLASNPVPLPPAAPAPTVPAPGVSGPGGTTPNATTATPSHP